MHWGQLLTSPHTLTALITVSVCTHESWNDKFLQACLYEAISTSFPAVLSASGLQALSFYVLVISLSPWQFRDKKELNTLIIALCFTPPHFPQCLLLSPPGFGSLVAMSAAFHCHGDSSYQMKSQSYQQKSIKQHNMKANIEFFQKSPKTTKTTARAAPSLASFCQCIPYPSSLQVQTISV